MERSNHNPRNLFSRLGPRELGQSGGGGLGNPTSHGRLPTYLAAADLTGVRDAQLQHELTEAHLALSQSAPDRRPALIADARKHVTEALGNSRRSSPETLLAVANVVVDCGKVLIGELPRLTQYFVAKLKDGAASKDQGGKLLATILRSGLYPGQLLSQLCAMIEAEDAEISRDVRHQMIGALSQSTARDHRLMKLLFRSCTWEEASLRKSEGPHSENVEEERAIMRMAAQHLDLGEPEFLNLVVQIDGVEPGKIKRYTTCDNEDRYALLMYFSDFGLCGTPSFQNLLTHELNLISNQGVELALATSANLSDLNLDARSRERVCSNFASVCEASSNIRADVAAASNEEIIGQYLDLLEAGFYHQGFHAAFEETIMARLTATGRKSATAQKDSARLCEIAATVTTCTPEFKACVVQRADEHLVTALDDKNSAFQLMTHIAFIAPEKWQHVASRLKLISDGVAMRLTPQAARCYYLLSRMAGLPCYDVNLIAEPDNDRRSHEARELAEYLGRVWPNVISPRGEIEPLGLKLGIIDVAESPTAADLSQQRRGMALAESAHPSTSQPVRDLSQIYEKLFERLAPEIRVVRVVVPDGTEEARETALREAIYSVMYSAELDEVESGDGGRSDGDDIGMGRTVSFD